MSTALFLLAALTGQYPDSLDHLRAGGVTPQVSLLLDRSCSMAEAAKKSDCTWFASLYNAGSLNFSKNDTMRSVLVGCRNADDGLLDRWSDKINFSIYEFGTGTSLRAPFNSTKAVLEAGAIAVAATGSTYMSQGLRDNGNYFKTYFNDANTKQCRPNFIVMLSDGNPNGGASTFNYECTPPVDALTVAADKPWLGAGYLRDHEDILCSVTGNQNITTYTIGLGEPGTFSPSNLQNIASYGGGEYFYASDVAQLGTAFESIVSSISAKSALFFAPIAIQTGSLFSENFAFAASFRPEATGPWRGTVKKYCITPPILANGDYNKAIDTCIFTTPDGKSLETNPFALDLFTGLRGLAADYGGSGEALLTKIGAHGPLPTSTSLIWSKRNVITWRPGESGYVKVTPTTWDTDDAWTNGCEHYKLLNLLHGYTYDADCVTGKPTAFATWPSGDPVHFSPVLLRYGPCEKADGTGIVGACYVVSGSNDGIVHIYDAANGDEKTALVPGDLWERSDIVSSSIRDMLDQPNLNYTHRFFVDGEARLFHDDTNADAIIQKTEQAYLVFGLGRGGRAYYSIPVSELSGGALDSVKNPIHPLLAAPTGDFTELHDTWSAPWMGIAKVGDSALHRVAAFGTGHIKQLDLEGSLPEGADPEETIPAVVDVSTAKTVTCSGANKFAAFNGFDQAKWCNAMYFTSCKATAAKPCYDGAKVPLDQATKPLTFNDGLLHAAAIRIEFAEFDFSSSDKLQIEDAAGNLIGTYSTNALSGKKTPWIYDEFVVLRLITNGVDTKNLGYKIKNIEWVPGDPIIVDDDDDGEIELPPFTLGDSHKPSVFLLDLDRWNDKSTLAFNAVTPTSPVLLRVTNDCTGSTLGTKCIDQTKHSDLQYMVCPISAELTGFDEAGLLKALYWGDECGQIWKLWTDDRGGTYQVRRLINLNAGTLGVSKDHRKILRKLDLVTSVCPGQPVIGLYFGTGDVQRPAAFDELATTVTNGRDLVGVLWDYPALPKDVTEANLKEVTAVDTIDPKAVFAAKKYGWYVSLRKNERMLRDPLVFDQVVYYKTYEPTTAGAECSSGSGVDRIYAIDSCSSAAAEDLDGDGSREIAERAGWTGETEVGGGLLFFTPRDAPVLVSHADLSKKQKGELNRRERRRPSIFLFREL